MQCVQYSPKITPHDFQYVHHLFIFMCNSLNETEVGSSAPCDGFGIPPTCQQDVLIAGWAVGGTVHEL